MADNRYDNPRNDRFRDEPRLEQGRERERQQGGQRPGGDRGFFERAGDEISSWFGDEQAERRREMDDRSGGGQSHEPGRRPEDRHQEGRQSGGFFGQGRDAQEHRHEQPRGDYGASPRQADKELDQQRQHDRFQEHQPRQQQHDDYRPFAGDYGRGSNPAQRFPEDAPRSRGLGAAMGAAAGMMRRDQQSSPMPQRQQPEHDPHYSEWRQRQIDALDNDYADYRREHQSKFDNDFSSWRGQRQTKRQMLGEVREHMDVVGSDEQPVGRVDKVQGDKIILTKDSQGGVHKSLGCAAIERIEGDRLILSQPADEARRQLIEERSFEERNRIDDRPRQSSTSQQSGTTPSDGPHNLERSFSGTYPNEQ